SKATPKKVAQKKARNAPGGPKMASRDVVRSAAADPGKRKTSAPAASSAVRSSGQRPAPRKRAPAKQGIAVEHISPAEAVAHIRELLDAKRERVRQGPNWPGAQSPQAASGGDDPHALNSSELSSEAAFSHTLAHQRGEQSKRKG
ncbi:MAG: hypothetical protein ABW154_05460, partial [Dyella sp.]